VNEEVLAQWWLLRQKKKILLYLHLIIHMLPAIVQRKLVNGLESTINLRPPTRTVVEICPQRHWRVECRQFIDQMSN